MDLKDNRTFAQKLRNHPETEFTIAKNAQITEMAITMIHSALMEQVAEKLNEEESKYGENKRVTTSIPSEVLIEQSEAVWSQMKKARRERKAELDETLNK